MSHNLAYIWFLSLLYTIGLFTYKSQLSLAALLTFGSQVGYTPFGVVAFESKVGHTPCLHLSPKLVTQPCGLVYSWVLRWWNVTQLCLHLIPKFFVHLLAFESHLSHAVLLTFGSQVNWPHTIWLACLHLSPKLVTHHVTLFTFDS